MNRKLVTLILSVVVLIGFILIANTTGARGSRDNITWISSGLWLVIVGILTTEKH